MKKIYQYEVGILLDKTDTEYESYSQVWDKKHGYYNEDWGVEFSFDSAKNYIKDYVNNGVKNTYGIVSEIIVSDEIYKEMLENVEINGYYDTSCYDMDFSLENVIYSLIKTKENFIIK